MCIRSFFRVVCYFSTGDGSGSESYAKQKEKKKNIMGPCTKPAYTGKGFCFRVFHRTNVFSINSSFFRLFVWPVCHFGPRYSNETKRPKRNNKTTRATTHHEKPYKMVFASNDLLCAIITLS